MGDGDATRPLSVSDLSVRTARIRPHPHRHPHSKQTTIVHTALPPRSASMAWALRAWSKRLRRASIPR